MLCEGHMTVSQSGVTGYTARGRGGETGPDRRARGQVREVIRYDKTGGVEVGDEPMVGYETGRYDSREIGRHKKHDRRETETR